MKKKNKQSCSFIFKVCETGEGPPTRVSLSESLCNIPLHICDHTVWDQSLKVLPVFGRNRPEGKILETVGVFEAVKQHGKYETGQVRSAHVYIIQI